MVPIERRTAPWTSHARAGIYISKPQDQERRRGERWESLQMLTWRRARMRTSCLSGPDDRLEAAFAGARANLARFPSEQRLLSNMRTLQPPEPGLQGLFPVAISGAGRLAGWVFGNERLGGCTTLILTAFAMS